MKITVNLYKLSIYLFTNNVNNKSKLLYIQEMEYCTDIYKDIYIYTYKEKIYGKEIL